MNPCEPDSNFERCLAIVLRFEGGLSDDPNDRGGLTNYGILQRVYSAARTEWGLPVQSVARITLSEVRAIYLKDYWIPSKAAQFAWPLNLVSFDGAVNCGPRQEALWLQRALGVLADGLIGPKTLAAAEAADPVTTSRQILTQRKGFYIRLADRDSSQQVFLGGWLNRVEALRERLAQG
ncbi:MAG: hypothetical protein RLZZ244_1577 [Verrucomicrobiota bacterium]